MIAVQSGVEVGQDQNPQLQQPPLQIQMDPSSVDKSRIKCRQQLQRLSIYCLQKISQMRLEAIQNQRLQKYFHKAGTNRNQIVVVFDRLRSDIQIFMQNFQTKGANLTIIGQVLMFLHHILKVNDLTKMKNIQKAIWIVQFQSKVLCSMQFIMRSLFLPYDITTSSKQRYSHVWAFIKMSRLGDLKNVQKGMAFAKKILAITTSACINQEQCKFAFSKLFSFGISYPHYFFSNKQGQLRSMIFYRKPTIQMARKIWNLPQNGMTRQLSKIQLKSIISNFKIYIPIDEKKQPTNLFEDDGQSIQVRVLHNQKIYTKNNQKKSKFFGFYQNQQVYGDIQQIILHMHGGGFLALSSRSMQVYTRRWARELKIPVFSVDYRMPPQYRFPTAPLDCLRVYKFLVQKIHKYLNINPKKIIIAGDSAGGNLSFALTGLILRQRLPIPHGIFTAYPACSLRKLFSPAKLYAFTDPLLNPQMLLLCLKQYLSLNEENQINPMASPIFITEQFVGGKIGDLRFPKNWPRTIIQVGAQDPLYDDSLMMMQRMVSSGVNCQCYVYQNLSHGFLNLQFMIPEVQQTVNDSIKHLYSLLK